MAKSGFFLGTGRIYGGLISVGFCSTGGMSLAARPAAALARPIKVIRIWRFIISSSESFSNEDKKTGVVPERATKDQAGDWLTCLVPRRDCPYQGPIAVSKLPLL